MTVQAPSTTAPVRSSPTPRRRSHRSPRVTPYLFLLPFFVVYLTFMLYPVASAFGMSLLEQKGFNPPSFVGLQNYADLLGDARFLRALANTTIYSLGSVFILSPLALLLAVAINSFIVPSPRLKAFYRVGFFLPNITSLVVVSIIFGGLLSSGSSGPANEALGLLGLQSVDFLGNGSTVLPTIIGVAVWAYTGLNALYFLSGLQAVPRELYEAAAIDGGGAVRIFFSVTLPLLKPTIIFVVVQAIIFSFQIFELPFLLAGGGPGDSSLTLGIYLYQVGFTEFNQGYASALGYAIAVITLALVALQIVLFRITGGNDKST